jgi:magnesium transporter
MIRSLVIVPNAQASTTETDVEFTLRRNLTQEKLEKYLGEGCTMWVDIITPEAEEILWLEGWLHLSPTVIADLMRVDRRPTLLVYPQYIFLSLFQPHAHNRSIVGKEVHCIIGEHYCITVRQADASALEAAYDRVVQNPNSWQRGVAYFLYLTAQHIIDTYYPLLDRISNRLNVLEEKFLSDGDNKQAQQSVYYIKQQLIGLRQMIAPQREVLSNLIGERSIATDNEIQDLFQHLYERLLGIYDVIDVQRDLTINILEIIANQQSRLTGEAVNRLTIISLVFLPFTFFLGLFDSNLFTIGSPFIVPINGLILATVIIFLMVVSLVAMRVFFQRQGWL